MIDHTRHIGIFHAQNHSVTLIGAGGIGAITAIVLGKMGIGELVIFDDDQVDDINIATQFHRVSDIGKPKAKTIQKAVYEFSGLVPTTYAERIMKLSSPVFGTLDPYPLETRSNVIISGVDSIKSRKDIYKAVLYNWEVFRIREHDPAFMPDWWYIDARMASEYFQMFVMQYGDHHWYTQALAEQNDSDIPDEPCTSKATIYTAALAAGLIGATVRRIITGDQSSGILTYDIVKNQMDYFEMVPA